MVIWELHRCQGQWSYSFVLADRTGVLGSKVPVRNIILNTLNGLLALSKNKKQKKEFTAL